jgi:hypothetical protein
MVLPSHGVWRQVCRASSDDEFDAEIAAEMDRLFTDYDIEAVRCCMCFHCTRSEL